MIAVLRQDGRAGVVLPHGTLFRSGAEGSIRQKLLEADLVEGIVGLPSALFYNTGIPASVWIINKSKTEAQRNRLAIIDASSDFKEGKNQNELLDTHIDQIVQAYEAYTDVPKYMRVVPLDEIAANDYNLNISRYIDTSEAEAEVDLRAVKARIARLEAQEQEIDAKLATFLSELGL